MTGETEDERSDRLEREAEEIVRAAERDAEEELVDEHGNVKRPAQEKKTGAGSGPSRSVREPKTQNEHYWAIMKMQRKLTASDAVVAHTLHGLIYVEGKGKREVCAETLAKWAGIGVSTAIAASDRVVKLGLYNRLDNRKGGRGGRGKATYRPMVPTWLDG